ncbi:hypothetical protein [Microbacterium sp. G2-8]|uniref:hypothetical protein n=1 Tax=Microbacterium sp. G2-8 TaxID=2842454 RepID=UPI001C893919|nr:hypothetical protein [Microbacterium sp. G2-8]
MGFDDLVNKGKDAYEQNKDRVDDALRSEKAEEISDSILDKGEALAKKVAPDSADSKIDEVRAKLDGKIGDQ